MYGPAGDTDPNVAYTRGYGLTGDVATYARLEKITLPGGREIYYNYEDANQFMSLGRVANIAANASPDDANTYVAYKYLGASMVVDANHPAVPGGLRLTYGAGNYKANAPWHGHPAWGPKGLARESQGRPGRALANSHGRDARVTHGRDAHAAPLYDQAGNNPGAPGPSPRPAQGLQGPADPNANNPAHFRYDAWNRLATIHLDNGNTFGTLDANDTLLAVSGTDAKIGLPGWRRPSIARPMSQKE